MASGPRMNHLHILVRDVARSIAFYRDVFGMAEAYTEEENGERLIFLHSKVGDVLALHERDGEEAGSPGGMQHFGFQLPARADLPAALEAVAANGGRFLGYATWAEPESVAYVADPDGYTVEINAEG